MTILAQYGKTQERWIGNEERIAKQLIECTGIPDDKLYELTIALQTTLTM